MLLLTEKYSPFSKSNIESITVLYKVPNIFIIPTHFQKKFLRVISSVTVTEKIQKVETFLTLGNNISRDHDLRLQKLEF